MYWNLLENCLLPSIVINSAIDFHKVKLRAKFIPDVTSCQSSHIENKFGPMVLGSLCGTPVHVLVPNHKKANILVPPISSSLTVLQQRLFKIKQLKVRCLSRPGALQLRLFFLVQAWARDRRRHVAEKRMSSPIFYSPRTKAWLKHRHSVWKFTSTTSDVVTILVLGLEWSNRSS